MDRKQCHFELEERKGYAEVAEKKTKIWMFLFCVFCVTFAPSAFKISS